MSKNAGKLLALCVIGAIGVAGCGSTKASNDVSSKASNSGATSAASTGSTSSGKVEVGVILPDTQSSARWEGADRPLLAAAFKAAGVTADIQNAQNDKSKMATIADGMIQEGVKVLIITNLDSPFAAQIEQKAKAAGVKTIDYDRLTLGGSADYYVSFDNVGVGKLQGQGLVQCLSGKSSASIIEINGSPTDNNATLFKQGYDSVLDPKYSSGWKKVGDKSVPGWDNAQAGTIFEQLLTAAGGKVDGVLVANDGMAQSVITVLKKNHLQVPVTGQDATVAGLQSILRGDQCMTVYKAVKKEAEGAATAAIALIKGQQAQTNGTVHDGTGNRDVPSILLQPEMITKANVKDVVDDGYVSKTDLCTGDVAAACASAGIS